MNPDERRIKLSELHAQFEALRQASANATPEQMKAISQQTAELTRQMLEIMNIMPGLIPNADEDDAPTTP